MISVVYGEQRTTGRRLASDPDPRGRPWQKLSQLPGFWCISAPHDRRNIIENDVILFSHGSQLLPAADLGKEPFDAGSV